MKKKTIWITAIVLLLMAWVAGWLLIASLLLWKGNFLEASDQAIYSVRFGVLGTRTSGEEYLADEAAAIPLKYKDSGFRFGVEIASSDERPFSYYTVMHLPKAPRVITGDGPISQNPSTTIKMAESQGQGTIVIENWFDPGDPVGAESMDVFVNGKLIKTVEYTVTEDKGP